MIRFTIAAIDATAPYRPEGYKTAVLAAGRLVEGGSMIELSPEAYRALRAEYSPEKWQLPGPAEIAGNFLHAAAKWTAAGFPSVSRAAYHARMNTCLACPMWNPGKNLGLGGCERCGCTQVKHWLASEVCPAGLWEA